MKLLLDEFLACRFENELSQHEVTTVPETGWAGKTTGELLELRQDARLIVSAPLPSPSSRQYG
jgi:hypothetical protein